MNNPTISLTLSIPEIELVSALLGNCQVHSQQAEILVGLRSRIRSEAEALRASLAAALPPPETAKAPAPAKRVSKGAKARAAKR